jgi:hypothetical protein
MDIENNPEVSTSSSDKQELLERIQREYNLLLQRVQMLSPEQATRPGASGWSVKDNLAHLAAWEQMMLRSYLGGQPQHELLEMDEEQFARLDEDGINAVFHERNKDFPPEEVLRGLEQSHAEVIETLEKRPFEELLQVRYPDDPEQRPMLDWVIGNTYEHYREHRRYIEEILRHGG